MIETEYLLLKKEVNKIAFSVSQNEMEGTFIREPLNTWESIFDKEGKSNSYLNLYDEINKEFIQKQN